MVKTNSVIYQTKEKNRGNVQQIDLSKGHERLWRQKSTWPFWLDWPSLFAFASPPLADPFVSPYTDILKEEMREESMV